MYVEPPLPPMNLSVIVTIINIYESVILEWNPPRDNGGVTTKSSSTHLKY